MQSPLASGTSSPASSDGKNKRTVSNVDFARDFTAPLSTKQFVGHSGNDPIGTVLHCITHSPIYCESKNHDLNTKPSRVFTIVGISKVGWVHSCWKKPKGNKKEPRNPESKPLFEVASKANHGPVMQAIRSVWMYLFQREGKFDKGVREEASKVEIVVGMNIRINIQSFMYDDKKSGNNVFPSDTVVIPENSLVELIVTPTAVNAEKPGWGLKLESIRPLPFTMYSYLTPVGLDLLPSTLEDAEIRLKEYMEKSPSIQAQLESSSLTFFADVHPKAFITSLEGGLYRLTSGEKDSSATSSVNGVDILEDDLLRFTNGGKNIGYSIMLCDWAASAGALKIFVMKNPYFVRQAQKESKPYTEFRGIPFIDVDKLLAFTLGANDGGDDTIQYDFPHLDLEQSFMLLHTSPTKVDGVMPTCIDLPLRAPGVQSDKAYKFVIGTAEHDEILDYYYAPNQGSSGARVARAGARIDYLRLSELVRH